MEKETTRTFSRDGNGIPKSDGIADAWDIVDSGTGFVRSENVGASYKKTAPFGNGLYSFNKVSQSLRLRQSSCQSTF